MFIILLVGGVCGHVGKIVHDEVGLGVPDVGPVLLLLVEVDPDFILVGLHLEDLAPSEPMDDHLLLVLVVIHRLAGVNARDQGLVLEQPGPDMPVHEISPALDPRGQAPQVQVCAQVHQVHAHPVGGPGLQLQHDRLADRPAVTPQQALDSPEHVVVQVAVEGPAQGSPQQHAWQLPAAAEFGGELGDQLAEGHCQVGVRGGQQAQMPSEGGRELASEGRTIRDWLIELARQPIHLLILNVFGPASVARVEGVELVEDGQDGVQDWVVGRLGGKGLQVLEQGGLPVQAVEVCHLDHAGYVSLSPARQLSHIPSQAAAVLSGPVHRHDPQQRHHGLDYFSLPLLLVAMLLLDQAGQGLQDQGVVEML